MALYKGSYTYHTMLDVPERVQREAVQVILFDYDIHTYNLQRYL